MLFRCVCRTADAVFYCKAAPQFWQNFSPLLLVPQLAQKTGAAAGYSGWIGC